MQFISRGISFLNQNKHTTQHHPITHYWLSNIEMHFPFPLCAMRTDFDSFFFSKPYTFSLQSQQQQLDLENNRTREEEERERAKNKFICSLPLHLTCSGWLASYSCLFPSFSLSFSFFLLPCVPSCITEVNFTPSEEIKRPGFCPQKGNTCKLNIWRLELTYIGQYCSFFYLLDHIAGEREKIGKLTFPPPKVVLSKMR